MYVYLPKDTNCCYYTNPYRYLKATVQSFTSNLPCRYIPVRRSGRQKEPWEHLKKFLVFLFFLVSSVDIVQQGISSLLYPRRSEKSDGLNNITQNYTAKEGGKLVFESKFFSFHLDQGGGRFSICVYKGLVGSGEHWEDLCCTTWFSMVLTVAQEEFLAERGVTRWGGI